MKTFLVCVALLSAGIAYAETARTARPTELHADSQTDAATLATLPENTALEVLQRRGAWSQVKAGAQTGWVRMLNLRFDANSGATAATPNGSGNPLGGLNNLLASGRTSKSGTETSGVRGLTEEDLNNAQPNPAEFQKMQKFATDKNVAQAYGKHSKLTVATVPYLAAPAKSGNDSSRQEAY